MAEANLNKAHHIMTYLSILFLPIILSWLLTKLVEASHDLSCCQEWNTFTLWSVTTPGSTAKRRRQDDQSRLRAKPRGRSNSCSLTFYRLP
jgi:hypothetical protein